LTLHVHFTIYFYRRLVRSMWNDSPVEAAWNRGVEGKISPEA
jgi:hypothetical protein